MSDTATNPSPPDSLPSWYTDFDVPRRPLLLTALAAISTLAAGCATRGEPTPEPSESRYPVHTDIGTTVFWIGEEPSEENGHISNLTTEWDPNPLARFGFVDAPDLPRDERGHVIGQAPLHNDCYCALPVGEFDENGPVLAEREASYWADEAATLTDGESLFKGRWVKIVNGVHTVYAQIVDTGPFSWTDRSYVWGSARPANTEGLGAGLDVSPSVAALLHIDGHASTSWQFVDYTDVPDGPWRDFPEITNRHFWN